jgi:hypothetical protein
VIYEWSPLVSKLVKLLTIDDSQTKRFSPPL